MSSGLPPWAYGPYELLLHAEMHKQAGDDFDRCIALISFDNAIEVSITVYLSLDPVQRQGRSIDKKKVDGWLKNYHRKMDFLFQEIRQRKIKSDITKEEIIWYHRIRNSQYHGGGITIPQSRDLQRVRQIAMWIFSFLFNVQDTEQLISNEISQKTTQNRPTRNQKQDILIDKVHGTCEVAGQTFYTSEALYMLDPVLYSEIATSIATEDTKSYEEDN